MSNDRWDQICSAFNAALQVPVEQRDALLRGACGEDDALRAEVLRMLEDHARATQEDLLEAPSLMASYAPTPDEAVGSRIGPYRILQRIGEGGFGVVYMAEQERPIRRRVALKVIKPGMDSAQVVARFEAERQALALMDHPGIARVFDGGSTESRRPFFVMELVNGVPVTRYCDETRLNLRERLALFVAICHAIQHAHQKGVIHRDLKPSNVLVTMLDSRPVPKVIDFGVAKAISQRLTEKTMFTQFGAVVGTYEYMSPEQAGLSALDVDTRGDIYSLGVMLYELLTGTTPLEHERLRQAGFDEIVRRIKQEDPPSPSLRLSGSGERLKTIAASRGIEPEQLKRTVRGELDWVVMKALEKDRNRRYETANGFARDVQRYLDGDPVEASPPSAWYRVRKLATKHRMALTVSGAFALLLTVATAVSGWLAVWGVNASNRSEQDAAKAKAEARRATEASELAKRSEERAKAQARLATSGKLAFASASELNHRLDLSLLLAVEALRAENTFEARSNLFKVLQDRPALRTFLHIDEGVATIMQDLSMVAFSPDGKTVATGYCGDVGDVSGVVLFDVASRQRLPGEPLVVQEGRVVAVAFSPDGKIVAAGHGDGGLGGNVGGVVLFDMASRKRLTGKPLVVQEGGVTSVAFSPDGKIVAAGYGAFDRTRRVVSGGLALFGTVGRMRLPGEPLAVKDSSVGSVAFSPDGKVVAAGYGTFDGTGRVVSGGLALFDTASRNPLPGALLLVKEGNVMSIAFSPDGKIVAARFFGEKTGGVVLFDMASRKRLWEDQLAVKEGVVWGVAFSPDGKTIAAGYGGSHGGGVVLFDRTGRRPLSEQPLSVSEGRVGGVAFSPDGKCLAARYPGGVALFNTAARERLVGEPLAVREGAVDRVAFNGDGKAVAGYVSGKTEHRVALFDVASRKRLSELPIAAREFLLDSAAFSPDGKTLAIFGRGRVVVFDVAGRKRLSEQPLAAKDGIMSSVALSFDGKIGVGYYIVGALLGNVGGVIVFDVAGRKRLWEEALSVKGGVGAAGVVALSPIGKTVAAGNASGVVVFDVASRKRLWEEPLPVKVANVFSIAFSPDGKFVAASFLGPAGSGVVVFDVAIGKRLWEEPLTVNGLVSSVAFSPDGKIVAAGYSGGVVLFDLAARGRLIEDTITVKVGSAHLLPTAGLNLVSSVAFSPDGKSVAAGFGGGGFLMFDVDPESWQRVASEVANRNFTRKEWSRFFPGEPYRATFPDLPLPPEIPSQERKPGR